MPTRTGWMTTLVGLCMVACGTERVEGSDAVDAPDAAALTLPFPDEYFGMLVARDAGARADPPEGCAALLQNVTTAWDGIQGAPEFVQLTDTPPWQKMEPLRDAYASGGCFTSGPTLSQPSDDCAADFAALVAAWDEVERTPQFHVLISTPANHDVYASWVDAEASLCVLGS